jgi:hypothetical protein
MSFLSMEIFWDCPYLCDAPEDEPCLSCLDSDEYDCASFDMIPLYQEPDGLFQDFCVCDLFITVDGNVDFFLIE